MKIYFLFLCLITQGLCGMDRNKLCDASTIYLVSDSDMDIIYSTGRLRFVNDYDPAKARKLIADHKEKPDLLTALNYCIPGAERGGH